MKLATRIVLSFFMTMSCFTFAQLSPVQALSATTTTVSMSPNPAVAGQSVTLTATPSVPGLVTFTVGGQTVGTGQSVGAGTTVTGVQNWTYTGNSSQLRIATNSSVSNVFVSTWNGDDCSGGRCVTKQLSPGGGVTYAGSESWNGQWVLVTGLAVDSNGAIYEGIYNGSSQNTIRKRTSIGATSSQFVPASAGISGLTGMTIDSSNNLYVTSSLNGKIFKVTSAGVVSTYATGLGTPIGGPVFNSTTGVLYYVDGNKDIMKIPAGGGAATLLTAASCNMDTNPVSQIFGNTGQLAIDSAGFLYGAQCEGVTPSSSPNASPITQVNPATGAMREYMSWSVCMNGSLSNGWAANCGGGTALGFLGNALYTAGAHMGSSGVYGMNPSGYVATYTYTAATAGTFAVGANLAPTDSGTYSASSGTGSLSVRPAAPAAPDLASSSDLGSSSSDDNTNDSTPLIEVAGSGTSGNTITVTATKAGSTNVSCSYVLPTTGCSLGTLSDGTWSISATETHPTAGASTASVALSVSIDTSAPTAPGVPDLAASSDSGTDNTDNNTNDSTPTLSATGGSTGDTITLSATNGTDTVACTYVVGSATNCTLPTLSDGAWTISSSVTDPAGNSRSNATSLTMRVDTNAVGGLAVDLAASSDTGSSSTDNNTSDTTPTFSLTGQATGDVVVVTASRAGATDVTCTYTVGVASSCTLGNLSDGSWSVAAAITDISGNTGNIAALPLVVATSAASPAAPDLVDSSDTGTASTDNLTSDTTPSISGGALPVGTSVTATARLADGTTVSCTYVVSVSVMSCDLPVLSDGVWSVSTVATDLAGNVSAASPALSITIDSAAPSLGAPDLVDSSDTGTSSSDNLTSDTTPSISGGTLPTGTSVTASARKSDGTTVSCTYVVSVSVTSCDLPVLSDGVWSVSTVATDLAGNVSAASPALSITINKSLLNEANGSQSNSSSGALPQDIAALQQTSPSSNVGSMTATARLRNEEIGRASHVVFVVQNADGSTATTVRMKVPPKARQVSTRLPRLSEGQRIMTFVENNFGLSRKSPKKSNVVQGPTGNGYDSTGQPKLIGASLLVDRIIFDPASPALDVGDQARLNQLARELRGRGGLLLISGFARQNLIDGSKFLKTLSLERARNVADYLSTKGVRAWIRFDGYGAITTTPGTADDRRVEIRWSNAGRRVL
jgi:large repetitive protein